MGRKTNQLNRKLPFNVKIASCLHLPKAALLGQGCVSSGEAKNTYGTGAKTESVIKQKISFLVLQEKKNRISHLLIISKKTWLAQLIRSLLPNHKVDPGTLPRFECLCVIFFSADANCDFHPSGVGK